MSGRGGRNFFWSDSFVSCPFCRKTLPNVAVDQHIECSDCKRCLTCEEKKSRGWTGKHPTSRMESTR